MHALVTSPVPSHPQNHGNRARVYAVCRELQARGYQVHFLYGGLEGLSDTQEQAMRSAWEHVYVLPTDPGAKKRSTRRHHLIDDWYVPQATNIIRRILNVWDIKFCLANYVWFSKWLEIVPRGIPRYIDTHDVFGNRHKTLKRAGQTPTWFSTTPKEEAKALARADTVIAIQDREAEVFRSMTKRPVVTLGFFDAPQFLDKTTDVPNPAGLAQAANGHKLKVGYIASDNPINKHALGLLVDGLKATPALSAICDFYLAGPICDVEAADGFGFHKLGFVPSVEGFYADMDIILNPNIGGSGLKIKSVEALRFGRPLIATADAMIGIASPHPLHNCTDVGDLCTNLMRIAQNPAQISALQQAGRQAFLTYRGSQLETLDHLFPRVSGGPAGDMT